VYTSEAAPTNEQGKVLMLRSKSCADEERREVCMPLLRDKQTGFKVSMPRSNSQFHDEMRVDTYHGLNKSIIASQLSNHVLLSFNNFGTDVVSSVKACATNKRDTHFII